MSFRKVYPFHDKQIEILVEQLIHTNSCHFLVGGVLVLRGDVDFDRFAKAVQHVIESSDIFKLRIISNESSWENEFYHDPQTSLTIMDFCSADDPGSAAEQWALQSFNKVFALDHCLADLALLKVSDTECRFYYKFHHLVMDGYGVSVLFDRVASAYNGQHLMYQESSYASVLVKHQEYLDSKRYVRDATYWKNRIPHWPVSLHKPQKTDVLAIHQEVSIKREVVNIDTLRTDKWLSFNNQADVSLQNLTVAALAILYRHKQNEGACVIGVTTHGRRKGEYETLGLFSRALPVALEYNGDKTVDDCVQAVKRQVRNAYRHAQYPISHLIKNFDEYESQKNFFDVIVNELYVNESQDWDGLHAENTELSGQVNVPLALRWMKYEGKASYTLEISYSDYYFNQFEILNYVERLFCVLDMLCDGPQKALSEIEILTANEQLNFDAWNETEKQLPPVNAIHELFERQVSNNPDALALIVDDQSYSYTELNAQSNQLANYLIHQKHVRPDELVGILLSRSVDTIVAVLAVIKSGAAYLMLDPELPDSRLSFMIEDSALKSVITHKDMNSRLKSDNLSFIGLDVPSTATSLEAYSSKNIPLNSIGLSSNNLAYAIYTSGSTGVPKGVLIEHKGLCNLASGQIDKFNILPKSRVLQFASFAFDASASEIWTALSSGAALVMPDEEIRKSPERLDSFVSQYHVSHATLPPSLLPRLNKEKWQSVNTLIVAGESCSKKLADIWSTSRTFINAYGPSEYTVCASLGNYEGNKDGLHIGKPLQNTQLYVLDSERQRVPVGEEGELYIGGLGLARGYLNNESLTAEKFIDHTFSNGESQRLYKTGDVVRWLSSGNLFFVGRVDDQVKIHGFRIELGEINSVLETHPDVKYALTLLQESVQEGAQESRSEKRLVTFFIPSHSAVETLPLTKELRKRIFDRLPHYMVPAEIVAIESFPRTTNGKIDKTHLLSNLKAHNAQEFIAPRSDEEKILSGIWCDLLDIDSASVYDNFFGLGGHSLLVVSLIARLKEMELSISLREVFTAISLEEMALSLKPLDEQLNEINEIKIPEKCERILPEMISLTALSESQIAFIVSRVPGGAPNVKDIYPLAPLQEGILFHHRMSGEEGDVYTTSGLFSFDSKDDRCRYIEALKKVIQRHDVLRTLFLWDELSEPVQVVLREAELHFSEITLNNTAEALDELVKFVEPGKQRLTLSDAPLIQVKTSDANGQSFLVLIFHHIIFDHVGLEIISEEVKQILGGNEDVLPTPVSYREFVSYCLRCDEQTKSNGYFERALGSVQEPTFPFGLGDIHQGGREITEVEHALSPELCADIRNLAKRVGTSPSVIFHAAWGWLVGVCSGKKDVVFGTVLSGRMHGSHGVENTLGLFINTLPLRLSLESNAAQLIEQTKVALNTLMEHEQASLSHAQSLSGLEDNTPLFSALLNYRHMGKTIEDAGADIGMKFVFGEERTNYPFSMSVNDLGEKFSITAQIDHSISAERIAHYYITAVERIVTAYKNSEERNVCQMSFIGTNEQKKLLNAAFSTALNTDANTDSNIDDHNIDTSASIHKEFEKQVINSPLEPAIKFQGETLSFAEINQRANRVAHFLLQRSDASSCSLVGLYLDNSLDLIISLLGVLKAGMGYVPLDIKYPNSRIDYMVRDAKLDVVITHSAISDALLTNSVPHICLDENIVSAEIEKCSIENPLVEINETDIAYVVYTSGSSGEPKGVAISHQSWLGFLYSAREHYGVQGKENVLQFSSISFDIFIEELSLSICSGGCLVLRKTSELPPVQEFLKEIDESDVSLVSMPTAYWHQICTEASASELARCKSLRAFIVGGEAMSSFHLEQWSTKNENRIRLFNTYGPTESTVVASCYEISEEHDYLSSVPIGKPFGHVNLLVLDEHLNLVPEGVEGELYIGGAGLARGYLHREELTASRFILNPFNFSTSNNSSSNSSTCNDRTSSPENNSRLYRTGDRVKWLPDGNLLFLGRMDDQVKIRGYRVELGEVEHHLRSQDHVNEAVVIAWDGVKNDGANSKRLAAYLVMENMGPGECDNACDALFTENLRAQLTATLPDYLVPSTFTVLDELPLTPNGKLDKKALPAPDFSIQQDSYIAPVTTLEKTLCSIWAEVLELERVGLRDNFFHLGGHSLLATKAVTRMRQACQTDLPLKALFEYPTIEALTETIEQHQDSSVLLSAIPVGAEGPHPLSYAQQRLWFIDQLTLDSGHYIMAGALVLEGHVDLAALTKAFSAIVERHEILRTVYLSADNTANEKNNAHQVVRPATELCLPVHDLSEVPASTHDENLKTLFAEIAETPFDLHSDSMLRVELVRLSDTQHVVMVSMHHIAADGWSIEILTRELSHFYTAEVNGTSVNISPLPIQYTDYAHWQRNYLQGEVLAGHRTYWCEQLANLPEEHSLPLDYPRPAVQSAKGAHYQHHLNGRQLAALTALANTHDVTLFMVLNAAFSVLLSRHANQEDIVVGTPIANREQAEVADLIGFFVNTLVIRNDLSGDPEFTELLARSKATLLGAYAHQQMPFEMLVDELQPERSLSHSPLFQVMLVLQNNAEGELAMPGVNMRPLAMELPIAKYDLTLSVTEHAEGLTLEWEYATALFKEESIANLAARFEVLVDGILADPTMRVSTLPLLTEAEQSQLLEWNQSERAYPSHTCIHELFEAHAANRSDEIALVYGDEQVYSNEQLDGDEQVTYGELNTRANQLAHYLRTESAVEPDCLIGICLPRSVDMIVAMLGIIKAGGAYVPLDPEYPEARLQHMVSDAGLSTVISTRSVLPTTGIDVLVEVPQRVYLDDASIAEKIAESATENIAPGSIGLKADHLAYVIYTSGSTGKPKASLLAHRGLSNLACEQMDTLKINGKSRVLQFASISFDAATWEWVMALCSGASLWMTHSDVTKSAELLGHFVQRNHLTHATLPPSLLPHLTQRDWISVETLVVAGESCPLDFAKKWSDGRRFFNAYGPSETTVCATIGRYVPGASVLDIGRAIQNFSIYILDAKGQVCPIGVIGEIYISGVGVARGYLNRDELNQEKFIPNTFDNKSNFLYRTGDNARWLPEGNLEFIGRADDQVKVRGFRIEPGEIEYHLRTQDFVGEAFVHIHAVNGKTQNLVAYVVLENSVLEESVLENSVLKESLREKMQDLLPSYMLPSAFVVLESLPLTSNGKVDKNALPEPIYKNNEENYLEPRTAHEKILSDIWVDILDVERVSVHDNFFRLGGHSLLVMSLLSRLKDEGFDVSVRDVFRAESLAELAKAIEKKSTAFQVPPNLIPDECDHITPAMLPLANLSESDIENIVACVPGGSSNIQDVYPLTPMQEGMLFHHQMNTKGDIYATPTLFSFSSENARSRYIALLQKVVDRHDVLRTLFVWNEISSPVQVVLRQAKLNVIALATDEIKDLSAYMQGLCLPQEQRMDLSKAPLLEIKTADDRSDGRYFMLMSFHHIIFDHVGLDIIENEIGVFLKGEENTLASPLPYRNFVAELIEKNNHSDSQAFFTKALSDIEETTAPFGLIDTQNDGSQILESEYSLPEDVSVRIREAAKRLNVTPSVLFHAAWAMVLGTCSGTDNVVMGTVLSGRLQGSAGTASTLGLYINTLPLRLSLNKSASELIDDTQAFINELLIHEQTSLALAQKCSGVPSGTPLFSSVINYRHIHKNAQNLNKAMGFEYVGGQERTNYPFCVSINDFGDGFSLQSQIDKSVDANSVNQYFYNAIVALIDAVHHQDVSALLNVSILPETEKQTLFEQWNQTQKTFPDTQCIHELFEAQVLKTPYAQALAFENISLTYDELNRRANQLARFLVDTHSITLESLVGICIDKSVDMMVSILAVLKAGAAYVPLDPAYPNARLAYMIEDAQLSTIITHSSLLASTPVSETAAICIDKPAMKAAIAKQQEENLSTKISGASPSSLAYVIYTSGSTGKPKGVQIEHKGICNLASGLIGHLELGQDSRVLQFASFVFDASVFEIWTTFAAGGCLVIVPEATRHSADLLDSYVSDMGPTHAVLPPSLLGHLDPKHWASVKTMMVAGESCSIALADLWSQGRKFLNGYGPSEATVCTSFAEYLPGQSNFHVGRPIQNTQYYVLNSHFQPVPTGVEGELYIGGAGLARGYLYREELTASRFISNLFNSSTSNDSTSNPKNNSRVYRTGDRVKWLPDGNLLFLGRMDDQVKIRGYRVELGEVEHHLCSQDHVSEAVVIAWDGVKNDGANNEGVNSGKRLVAYLVMENEAECDVASFTEILRTQLTATLPDYLVPSTFTVMDVLPITPNGKVDKKALPEPGLNTQQDTYIAPVTALEKTLCSIWAEVLDLERVGLRDNFFLLGGHSLLATKTITRMRQACRVDLPLKALFEYPTIEALAEVLEAHPNSSASLSAIPAGIEGPHLLSYAQQRLWFIDQLTPDSGNYIMAGALVLEGHLDLAALTKAFSAIVERHEILRTVYISDDSTTDKNTSVENTPENSAYQVVRPATELCLPVHDLSGVSAFTHDENLKTLFAKIAETPFDLHSDNMLRVELVRLSDTQHVVMVSMHHIAADGWSIEILTRELSHFYAAEVNGKPASLSPLPIQYTDYAHWQRSYLQGEVLAGHRTYWCEQLANLPEEHSLPLDYPRPAVQSAKGAHYQHHLNDEKLAALNTLANTYDATLFMVLNAAFSVLLSRHANQEDIVVGTPIANREQAEVANLIGFFVNTLVIRNDLSGDPEFTELLERSKATLLGAYAHQQMPFEMLVDELQPERSLSHSPLFQVMLVLQNNAEGELAMPGVNMRPLAMELPIAKYDLTLSVTEHAEGLTLELEYATALFKEESIANLAARFEVLIDGILADPTMRVSALPLLTETEQSQLLEWNQSECAYPSHTCIHELFEAHVANRSDEIALVYGDEQVTYGELNTRANQLAHYLRTESAVEPDCLIGICLPRSVDMIVAMLGIIKAGGAYVPLDPEYPESRLQHMVSDAGLSTVISTRSVLPATGIDVLVEVPQRVYLDDVSIAEKIAGSATENIAPGSIGLKADHLAYVIYTSGSTGKPKGVMVEHRNICRLVKNSNYVRISENDVIAQASNSSFDAATFEVWGALCAGARLCYIDKNTLVTPEQLEYTINKYRISVLFITTALFNRVSLTKPSAFKHLSYLLFGGEMVDAEAVSRIIVSGKPRHLLHVYGPTENTTFSTFYEIEDVSDDYPIGKPLNASTCYVLGKNRELMPVNTDGELYLGGDGVARGYLNQPGLTAESFIEKTLNEGAISEDLVNKRKTERLYRTGDVVRLLHDGNIKFVGRADNQVKIRGFRIELGEIEKVLSLLDEVQESAVFLDTSPAGEKCIVAYIVPEKESGEINADAMMLREKLSTQLPEYMMPSVFELLDAFPLTPNGKIDKKKLPKPSFINISSDFEAPISATEKSLSELWCKTLGIDRVGRHDNFFHLGGHSLLATKLLAEVRNSLNVDVPLKTLFSHPVLKDFAKAFESAEVNTLIDTLVDKKANTMPKIQALNNVDSVKLSYAQQRLWFIDQFQPESNQYIIPGALRMVGKLDVGALGRSLSALVERHSILRTVYRQNTMSGEGEQIVLAATSIDIPIVDVSDESESDKAVRIGEILNQEIVRPFDLTCDLMIRGLLIQLSDNEHIFFLNTHHIASDGWSMDVMKREIVEFYTAAKDGNTPQLEMLNIQYRDYAAWQKTYLTGEQLDYHRAYWAKQLEGIPPVHDLPLDGVRSTEPSTQGDRLISSLSKDIQQGLNNLAKAHDATLFMVLNAAFSIFINKHSSREDIVVGTPVANREQAEIGRLIGFFVNTLVIRNNLEGNPSFVEVLKRSKTTLLDAFAHQQMPFEMLVDKLQPERNPAISPLFQVMLVLQNNEDVSVTLPELELSHFEIDVPVAKYDITLTAVESDQGMELEWEFATALFSKTTIARFASRFECLLRNIIDNSNVLLSDLSLIPHREEQLLCDWNKKNFEKSSKEASAETTDFCIHEYFEKQVERFPSAIAIEFGKETLSYSELNKKANQLAHYLQSEHHLKPDAFVGICLGRSIEMIVTILGVLKAGAAYVPLDPAYPESRIDYIINDSRLDVVISSQSVLSRTRVNSNSTILIDSYEFAKTIKGYSNQNIPRKTIGLDNHHLAYVIYTSGSTGQPKGVLIEHRNVGRLFTAASQYFSFDHNDVWSLFHSYAFDFSVWEMWGALFNGGKLLIIPEEQARSASDFYKLVASSNVTVLSQTPSAFNNFSVIDSEEKRPLSLRYIVFGGEALTPSSLNDWVGRHGDSSPEIINMYGITETTVHVTYKRITNAVVKNSSKSEIGIPLNDLSVSIYDRNMNLTPIGVVGEMYVGGAGVARGYLNRTELTEQRFVSHPVVHTERLYRTGDLARYTESGELEYIGRIDDQVKIRGYRIELGEIEQALMDITCVSQSVVLVRGERSDTRSIVAYLRLSSAILNDETQALKEIAQELRASLPHYMIPADYIVLDEFPVTNNGKINRAVLAEMKAKNNKTVKKLPTTPTEKIVCAICSDLLSVENLSMEDNFFEIGGNSLNALKLRSSIVEETGKRIAIRDIFENPVLLELSRLIDQTHQSNSAKFEAVSGQEFYATSHKQKADWVANQVCLANGYPSICTQHSLDFDHLDVPALHKTLRSLCDRHEILRTTLHVIDDVLMQKVHSIEALEITIQEDDFSDHNFSQKILDDLKGKDMSKIFDFAKLPLFFTRVIHFKDVSYLVMTFDHICGDQNFFMVLATEFEQFYSAYSKECIPEINEKRYQFKDYAVWESEHTHGVDADNHRDYWAKLLGKSDDNSVVNNNVIKNNAIKNNVINDIASKKVDLEISYERYIKRCMDELSPEYSQRIKNVARGAVHTIQNNPGKTAAFSFQVESDVLDGLRRIAIEKNTTLSHVLIAAFTLTLHKISQKTKIIVTLLSETRFNELALETGGCLIGEVLVVNQIEEGDSFESLVERTTKQLIETEEHKLYPMAKIMDDLDLSIDALGGVMMNYVSHFENEVLEASEPEHREGGFPALDLNLAIAAFKNGISVDCQYRVSRFDSSAIESMMKYFTSLLSEVVRSPKHELHVFSEYEKYISNKSFSSNRDLSNVE